MIAIILKKISDKYLPFKIISSFCDLGPLFVRQDIENFKGAVKISIGSQDRGHSA